MNKKFDCVKFQREQRTRLSEKISKLSDSEIVAFFETKTPPTKLLSRKRRARARA